jgi:hypothetical protein
MNEIEFVVPTKAGAGEALHVTLQYVERFGTYHYCAFRAQGRFMLRTCITESLAMRILDRLSPFFMSR